VEYSTLAKRLRLMHQSFKRKKRKKESNRIGGGFKRSPVFFEKIQPNSPVVVDT
jgi:hypothetical protein